MLGAGAVIALAISPVFMLLLGLVLAAVNPAESASTLADYFSLLPTMPIHGLIPGVPLAVVYAALLSLLARQGWDAIGVALLIGVAIGLVLEIVFIAIATPEAGTSLGAWDLSRYFFQLLLPFAGASALMCAIYWRMVIRHQRLARLAAKQAADAIRTME